MRTSANGSFGSSTEALMIFSARSCTRPASGPHTSTIGRSGLGRATNASTSAALSATIVRRDRARRGYAAGGEIGRQARLDVVGNDLGGAVLGVALAARVGEALLLSGVVVGHAREGLAGHHRFAGRDLDQRIGGVDAELLHVRRARW